jgi:hypothetical protein
MNLAGFVTTVLELQVFIKGESVLDYVSDCYIPKENSAPWSYLVVLSNFEQQARLKRQ